MIDKKHSMALREKRESFAKEKTASCVSMKYIAHNLYPIG